MELNQDAIYCVALTMIPGVGSNTARKLINWAGGAKEVFQKIDQLPTANIVAKRIINNINTNVLLDKAKQQIDIAQQQGICITYYTDCNYPRKLAQCDDAPLLYYSKGKTINFDTNRTIGIVGTRNTDNEGRNNIFNLIEGLKNEGIHAVIVSGLAAGADTFAHQAAIKFNVPTAAVLGHGFEMIYPAENRNIANQIANESGILITEYFYGHPVSKTNFPRRNRIVAGLCDALIIAQSRSQGGALITAEFSHQYQRDVFAYPGRAADRNYQGCNQLIRDSKATLITSHTDLINQMGWKNIHNKQPIQTELPLQEPLNQNEINIIDALRKNGELSIDALSIESNIPMSELLPILLSLEFKDVIKALPGKRYTTK